MARLRKINVEKVFKKKPPTTREVRKLAEETRKWMESPEGQKAMAQSLIDSTKMIGEENIKMKCKQCGHVETGIMPLKDHQIAELVNNVRDALQPLVGEEIGQSLRERISGTIVMTLENMELRADQKETKVITEHPKGATIFDED